MKIFFLRLSFILVIVFLQSSFLNIVFPLTTTPLLLIASIVAWVLLAGFPHALFAIIPLAILFDIVATGTPGTLTLYAIPLAYITSFLSRRLLVEHQGIGMLLYTLFTAIGAIGYPLFDFLFFRLDAFPGIREIFSGFWLSFSFSGTLFAVLFSLPLFFFAYTAIRHFEQYVGALSRNDFLNVK